MENSQQLQMRCQIEELIERGRMLHSQAIFKALRGVFSLLVITRQKQQHTPVTSQSLKSF